MKYKAIVFDYGGVIVTNGINNTRMNLMEEIGKIVGVSGDEFRQEYFKHNHITNVEGQPWVEAALSAVRVFDDSVEVEKKVRQINADFNNSKRLNTELLEKIVELKTAGYQIAILSNYTAELRNVLQEQGIYDHFDEVFVSTELGAQKPDPQAFRVTCDTLGIKPSEMIFIDDTPRSLATANEIGYTPILFRSNEQLFKEFDKLGV